MKPSVNSSAEPEQNALPRLPLKLHHRAKQIAGGHHPDPRDNRVKYIKVRAIAERYQTRLMQDVPGPRGYNLAGVERYTVAGKDKVSPGRHVITLDFDYDGGGVGKGGTAMLTVDGKKVASEHLPQTIAYRMSLDETLDIGEDTGTPVGEDYKVPFKFTGDLEKSPSTSPRRS